MSAAPTADFDPVAEQLLTAGRARKGMRLRGREQVTRWLFATGFLAAAIPLAVRDLNAAPTPSTAAGSAASRAR